MLNISLITLGCPKNQVDSEIMSGLIKERQDFNLTENPDQADIIVINTCGFIQDAKEEAISTIFQAVDLKEKGQCQGIIVTGCLTQRYKDIILKEIPEVDAILGTGSFGEINTTIDQVLAGQRISNVGDPAFSYKSNLPRILSTKHTAYVKIAEGCNNNCTYCAIPRIRGKYYSRSFEDILAEVKLLAEQGSKEIILVAQDTTQYGIDLYGQRSLVKLLTELVKISGIQWFRLMYTYPEYIDDSLLKLIQRERKICNYLDLPIQHSANRIRQLMNRKGKREDLLKLIKKIRALIPDIALRTSLIVGFPGETEEDFQDLLDFVETVQFERLGVFKYSPEEDTPAATFPEQILPEIKEKRYEAIMSLQKNISFQKNQNLIDKELEVIVDEIAGQTALARSQYDAPEIDNQIYLPAKQLKVGDVIRCTIKEALEYDLIGEVIHESAK